jgi:hypothetical protein
MIGSALPPSFDMIGEVRRRPEKLRLLSVHADKVGVTELAHQR